MNRIHRGFGSTDELLNFLKVNNVEEIDCYKIIEFKNMYYAVGFQNYDKQIIIGQQEIWYRHNSFMRMKKIPANHLVSVDYDIKGCRLEDFRDGIYDDMKKESKVLKMYNIKRQQDGEYKINQYSGRFNCYYTLLGSTFYDVFLNINDLPKLRKYFKNWRQYLEFMLSDNCIISINPFISVVKVKWNNRIENISFRPILRRVQFKYVFEGYELEKLKPMSLGK